MDNYNILVTGGKGFIGTNLIELLHVQYPNALIYNVDCGSSISNDYLFDNYSKVDWYQELILDLSEDGTYNNIPINFDCIIHLAAESHVDRSCESIHPFIKSNIVGTTKIAEFAIRHDIPMISVSTDECYGHNESVNDEPFHEDTPIAPRNPYASTKASADMIVQSLGNLNPNWKYVITRCGNNFGKHQDWTKFIPVIIGSIAESNKIPVYGDGKFYRSWIHVVDHCDAIIALASTIIAGNTLDHNVYNIGSDNCISNLELIDMICDGEDPQKYIEFIDDPRGKCHDRVYNINHDRISNELGWSPKYTKDFKLRIKETVDWYKGHYG